MTSINNRKFLFIPFFLISVSIITTSLHMTLFQRRFDVLITSKQRISERSLRE